MMIGMKKRLLGKVNLRNVSRCALASKKSSKKEEEKPKKKKKAAPKRKSISPIGGGSQGGMLTGTGI